MNSSNNHRASTATEKTSSGGAERWVCSLICAWLVIQPWLIGGRFWWSEALNTVVGVVGLGIGLRSAESRRTLLRFPVFWLGLLFCGYILCQALNPWAYAVQRTPDLILYDVYMSPHVAWLPAGIKAIYTQQSTWRTFVYWLGPWLLVCAWWAVARRRRFGRKLALVAFLNGIAMAVLVIFERFHPPAKILWFFTYPGNIAVGTQGGSFVDHNKTAAFLYLSMGAGLSIACRLQAQARERGRDSGLTWVVLFGCLIILASFFALGSRAGLAIACGVFIAGFVILLAASLLARDRSPGLWLGGAVLMAGVAGLGLFEYNHRDTGIIARIEYHNRNPEEDVRAILHHETLRMLGPHFWLGWGGGSYRYVSPDFFVVDNAFNDSSYIGGQGVQSDWAHSDWLQLPMEFGVIGASLLLAIVLYWYGLGLWLARTMGAAGLVILMAGAAMLAHSIVDFPIYNASILALFSLLLASTVKNAELEAWHFAKT